MENFKVFQRPKAGETEEDLLKQQENFLKASGKDVSFKRKIEDRKAELDGQFELIGEIVEKKPNFFSHEVQMKNDHKKGFPNLFTLDSTLVNKGNSKKSLFAMQLEKNRGIADEPEKMDVFEENETNNFNSTKTTDSLIKNACSSITSDKTIHEENVKKLSQMTEEEILKEQKVLLNTLDPSIIKFLKTRRKYEVKKFEDAVSKKEMIPIECSDETVPDAPNETDEEVQVKLQSYIDSRWINMDFIEKEKLQWIGDIPDKKSLEPDQPYSARFNFSGELQPFTTEIDVRNALYHHGDEPERPGYTIQELYQLSRSQILQQRILALNTLANIIRKTKLGYYDVCFDGQLLHKLVESDLFFLLRFSIDDNAIVPASIYCLYNLLCNECDEFCLDKLRGFSNCDEEPWLFNKMDAKKEEEGELKDHVIISCDLIKGVLRTDLLIRLAYILSNFSPERETVIRIINCLIRISRHSLEATKKILETPNLMKYIYQYIKTSKPIYEGVKLFRIMASQSKFVAEELVCQYDMSFLVPHLDSEENPEISRKEFYLLKLEIVYFWRALLVHALFVNDFLEWSPCLVRLLLFYTQKVDLNGENDFDFELFAALASLLNVCNKKKISCDSNIIIMMKTCLEKWLTQLIQHRQYNFAVSKAVGSIFRYFNLYFKNFGISSLDFIFCKKIDGLLIALFQSKIFDDMCSALCSHSCLLSVSQVDRDPDNLPSLCSVIEGGSDFVKIVQNRSSIPFFISITKYLKKMFKISHDWKVTIKLFLDCAGMRKYLSKICKLNISNFNWFMKYETNFLCEMLPLMAAAEDDQLLILGFSLVPMLRVDDKKSKKVLNNVMNKFNWKSDEVFFDHLDSLYSEMLQSKYTANYKQDLISQEWTYKILAYLRDKEAVVAVINILKFLTFVLKRNSKLLEKVSYTYRYYYLCYVFLNDSNVFDETIQSLMEEIFMDVVLNRDKVVLSLKLSKNKSFYDLFTEIITQYAGVSYGLHIFAKFVVLPLQNSCNVSFRKLLWFEYLHVLRVVTLPFPLSNFIDFKHFIYPVETDESLLVAYLKSLCSNVIIKKRNPFMYYLAIGNVKSFLDSEKQNPKLLAFINKTMSNLKNEELKKDILNFNLCDFRQ